MIKVLHETTVARPLSGVLLVKTYAGSDVTPDLLLDVSSFIQSGVTLKMRKFLTWNNFANLFKSCKILEESCKQ